jgi:hypothetical protein
MPRRIDARRQTPEAQSSGLLAVSCIAWLDLLDGEWRELRRVWKDRGSSLAIDRPYLNPREEITASEYEHAKLLPASA